MIAPQTLRGVFNRQLRRILIPFVVIGLLGGLLGSELRAQEGVSEYEIKAAFLFNFARFTSWPSNTFTDPSQPIVIGILGDDPFGPQILDGLKGKTIDGRPLVIRRFADIQSIDVCHVLFVGSAKDKDLPGILEWARHRNILTVGELPNFLASGGMIRFCLKDQKVRFDVNLRNFDGTSVKLSAKLLGVAASVQQ